MNGADVLIKFKGDTANASKSIDGLKSKIGSLASGIAKGLTTAVGIASTAIIGLTKSAVQGFADYEQLVGGVETLFKNSAKEVQGYAERAYQTAGISANKYMETVTSFSASLLQSLNGDTAKSAKIADMAIQDMADNANKMGTPMENIQSAYQAFAKQNYTLLDNLKLGYGGTRTEMERLLKDAQKITGVKYDISNLNDIFEAIHVIQGELGITGTTAKEASSTITGSLNMTKASFQDLMTAFGRGDNVDKALDNFMDSVMTFADNIMPVVERVLNSIANAIPRFVDKISATLPNLIKGLLPSLLQGAVALVNGIITALPVLIQTLLPALITGLIEITNQFIALLPELTLMIADMLPTVIPMLVEGMLQVIPALLEHLPEFLEAGFKLLVGLVSGLISALPKVLQFGVDFVSNLFQGIKSTIQKIPDFIKGVFNGIGNFISNFVNGVVSFFKNMFQGIINVVKTPINWIIDGINLFIKGLNKIKIPDWVPVVGGLGFHIKELPKLEVGTNYVPEDTLAMIHKGEAVVPKKFNPYANGVNSQTLGALNNSNEKQIINVYVESNTDPLGQVVSKIKTFSGGAKNDYNYGYGGM